ncbi:MAG: methionine adenosyltransferase, partial [Acholeplasmataceae bacterium]|nr:methionine adenosyltransferase [Acholeplasmataceae bacterium]
QSPDIALGVNKTENKEQGAGDQGIMFGYACNETQEFMPLPIMLAHEISKEVDRVRKEQYTHIFGPDGKCQVSVDYKDGKPVNIPIIVVSAQTKPGVYRDVYEEIIRQAILRAVGRHDLLNGTQILINPTGEFILGGPKADSGLTGRKIIVDTYGGYSRHGGGAFSGKDVSKVDRSATYYARFVAKALVAANLANRCEVCVSYSIGVANPVSVSVDTFGTGVVSDDILLKLIKDNFDFTPSNIIKELKLDKVTFKPLASYGHIGREDLNVAWENVDLKAKQLSEYHEKTKSTT